MVRLFLPPLSSASFFRLFLLPNPFVHRADDLEACALASHSTASSSTMSYLPLCPLLFFSFCDCSHFLNSFPSLPVMSSPSLPVFSPCFFDCLFSAPWLLVQMCVSTIDLLFTFVPFFHRILSC